MKIKVIAPQDNFKINLVIPNGLLMNHMISHFIYKTIQKSTDQFPCDEQKFDELLKLLKDSTKQWGHFDLVDVESKDGEIVKIQL
ncbi:MAG: hypothetical protein ACI4U3_07545 [Traorella sp.]